MADTGYRLVDVDGKELPAPTLNGKEVILPQGHTWTWCLDATHEGYEDMSDEEILKYAAGVRKRYVLLHSKKEDEE